MQPNKYQSDVYSHFEAMSGHSAVVSVAGSGKTTTALQAISYLPAGTSTLLGAFNTSIRDEFKERGMALGLKNITYTNFNGFGWKICMQNMKSPPELDKEKTQKLLEFVVYKPNYADENDMKRFNFWKSPIERLVSLFKSLNIHSLNEADKKFDGIVDYYNLDIPDEDEFRQCVMDTFQASMVHMAHFDFDDQKWMPLHHGWAIPKYDQVVLDEFQDTCPVEYALMISAAGDHGQFCAIGDPDQTIYGFKGAKPGIFDDYIKAHNAKTLPLSICYRCPIEVIKEAQKIVPRIEWAPGAMKGSVNNRSREEFLKNVQDRDFVLCRTTDELVAAQIALTRMGRKSKVRGRDFCTMLSFIIDRVSKRERNMPIAEFITRLLEYQIARSEQLKLIRRENEIINLEDRLSTIRALSEEATRVEDIFTRMKDIFTDVPHTGIDLMTVHKSKGLQSKNVWILRPDLLPHPRSSAKKWMEAEEMRLKYVGVTRAQENLTWVGK
jgi:DNA helicase-2/ATP-dependent DNA helicase PcrA